MAFFFSVGHRDLGNDFSKAVNVFPLFLPFGTVKTDGKDRQQKKPRKPPLPHNIRLRRKEAHKRRKPRKDFDADLCFSCTVGILTKQYINLSNENGTKKKMGEKAWR